MTLEKFELRVISKILSREYPTSYNILDHIRIGICLSIWVFVFLWFPEPFGFDGMSNLKKSKIIPWYSVSSGLVYFFISFLILKFSKQISPWRVKDELISTSLAIIIAIIILFLVHILNYNLVFNWNVFGTFLGKIFLPSALIIIPFLLGLRLFFGQYRINQLTESPKDKNSEPINSLIVSDNKFILKEYFVAQGEGKNAFFRIKSKELVYVKSDNNYVECYYLIDGQVVSKIIRVKLYEIQSENEFLIKSHRSYLFNPIHFRMYKKEGYTLQVLLSNNILIPISRSHKLEVEERVKLFLDNLD